MIKAAQEREELQRQGDELDAKIRKAEKEVTALEATLMQLVSANGSYGSKFKKVDNTTSVEERAALRWAGRRVGVEVGVEVAGWKADWARPLA